MEFNNLVTELSEGIFKITINRESKLNALNVETIQEIDLAIKHVYDNSEVHAAIITGQGPKAFVAGADIAEIADLNALNARKFSERGQEVFSLIENCTKPVIAAVNGFALGGGCELAMACHIRVASSNAKFGQPEVNLGLIPGYGGTQRLIQLIGKSKAIELMMTGDTIKADEALQLGLVNYVVESEHLYAKCDELIQKFLSKSPIAIGKVIECVNAYFAYDKDGQQVEANLFGNCCGTEDFIEGTTAFMEKRPPNFKGN